MILPTKHIPVDQSLLGAGAIILSLLEAPSTMTAVWERAKNTPEIRTYGRFILLLDFLYALSAIDLADGLIVKRELS